MNLTSMCSKFQAHTSGNTDDMDLADIKDYLNNIYSEFLPANVDGNAHRITWASILVANINPVSLPNRIVGFPEGKFWIQGTAGVRTGSPLPIKFYSDFEEFFRLFPEYQNSANTGQPCAVYRERKLLYFDKFPDDTYNLIAKARGQQSDTIPDDGLPFNHAMAIITAAAWNYLLEVEDEIGVAREAVQYETWKRSFLGESLGDFQQRTPVRSF